VAGTVMVAMLTIPGYVTLRVAEHKHSQQKKNENGKNRTTGLHRTVH